MGLKVYAVVFTTGSEKGIPLVKEAYPEALQLQKDVILVASNNLTSEIAKASALTKERQEEGVRGAVFKLNGSYTGFAASSLWEWLENAEETE